MEMRIPVIQEEIDLDKRVVETGKVRVRTTVSEREEDIDLALRKDEVVVERVAVNRPVDAPAAIRQEGDVTIVPVYEEVTVVTKQLILKEELHIRKRTDTVHETQRVTLRRQDVSVDRIPADGTPDTGTDAPAGTAH